MKIKEAAQVCGLTEKAIRLYESKGLVKPCTEEKNGRTYREYNEENIRTLTTIGVLRRASFSLEQIGIMQSQPEKIPEVFAAYRENIRDKSQRLTALKRAVETMETEAEQDIDTFAARLAAAMLSENITDVLTGETVEKALPADTAESAEMPTEVKYRWYTWDEDTPYDEKEEAYRRFIEKYERRERVKEFFISIPMKAWGLWLRIPKKLRWALCISVPSVMLCLVILDNICLTTPFSHTFECVLYDRGDPDPEFEPIAVTFDGELRRYIWQDDYYTGKLEIEGFYIHEHKYVNRDFVDTVLTDDELEQFYSDLRINYESLEGSLFLTYDHRIRSDDDRYLLDRTFGMMRNFESGEDMSLVWFVLEKKENGGYSGYLDTGCYIVYPAETRDDAEYQVRKYWELYSELYRLKSN